MLRETHPRSFVLLGLLFALFVLFLYGPTLTITVLSFQGPGGGLVFPMQGFSTQWFGEVFKAQSIGDIGGSFDRSIKLGLIVMLITVTLSFLAGLGFRKRFAGSGALFYVAVASLIMPSVVVSLGIGALFANAGRWHSALSHFEHATQESPSTEAWQAVAGAAERLGDDTVAADARRRVALLAQGRAQAEAATAPSAVQLDPKQSTLPGPLSGD